MCPAYLTGGVHFNHLIMLCTLMLHMLYTSDIVEVKSHKHSRLASSLYRFRI